MNPGDQSHIWGIVVDFLQFAGVAWVAFVQYVRKPGEDAGAALQGVTDRLIALEQAQKHVATNTDLAQLRTTAEKTEIRVEALVESQKRSTVQLDRIENFLLTRK
ncbi:MAG: hypothetical protein AB7I35_12225 [Ramlibacter sp.]|nr:hypothetical protein [Ramlibacter sp.]